MVIAEEDTVFVPSGRSIWEIGTDNKPQKKAEEDYKKRSDNSDPNTTFIFVTSLEFRDKDNWCNTKRQENRWKDVRAYDADDLENWLSVAPAVSYLWAEQIANIVADKVMPALILWDEWIMAMDGFLSPTMLCIGHERIGKHHDILQWLDFDGQSILRLKSYSHTDGKLFITASLNLVDGYGHWLVRCVMADEESTLRQLVASENQLFIITSNNDAGLARKAIANNHKYCILTSRSASNFPDQDTIIEIPLRLASYEVEKELVRLGMPESRAEILLRKTGRMLMALRREVAGEHPCWAEPSIRDVMSTVVFVAGWNEDLHEDREALESLSEQQYSEIEKTLRKVRITPESPIQYVEPYWKLLSPMDAWRCLGPQLSRRDFNRFREVVLSSFTTPDPVMELPPDKRWVAAIYNKRTPYSKFIRKGLLQSLIIIAEFGEAFLLEGIDHPQSWITQLVTEIFASCREEKMWEGLASSLKELAEAAPTAFLDELERRLSTDKPSLVSLLESKGDVMFSPTPHVHLIWGLERVAWFPEYIRRVANILIQLHELDPGGQMSPRPFSSLTGVFSPIRPQTMASWEEQQAILNNLAVSYPDSAYDLILALIPQYGTLLMGNNKPDWREISSTRAQYRYEIDAKSAWHEEMLIKLAGVDGSRWAKLVDIFQWVQPDSQEEVIKQLNILSSTTELQRSEILWDQIRRTVNDHRSYSDDKVMLSYMDALEIIYHNLTPSDIFKKNIWIFDTWPKTLTGRRNTTYEEDELELTELRENALSEILSTNGVEGVFEFARIVEYPHVVGSYFGHYMTQELWIDFYAMMNFEDIKLSEFCKSCLLTTLHIGEDWIHEMIERGKRDNCHPCFITYLCLALPNSRKTWEFVANHEKDVESEYWRKINYYKLFSNNRSDYDRAYAFEKIFRFGKSSTWFNIILKRHNIMTYEQVKRVLKAYLENQDEKIQKYNIMRAFEILRSFHDKKEEEIISLELAYYKAFEPTPPTLMVHKKLSEDVNSFKGLIQLLINDHKTLTPDFHDNISGIFRSWTILPGTKSCGAIDPIALELWMTQVCEEYSNSEHKGLVDSIIGGVLAHAPEDSEGRFPCKEVCDVFEKYITPEMKNGFVIGVYNKRGLTSRSPYEGGNQERILANKYSFFASMSHHRWPKVACALNTIKEHYEREGKSFDREKLHDEMYY